MDKELIKEILKYIEFVEEQIDGEWGSGRDTEELIEIGKMPELYYTLRNIYENK